MNKTSTVRARIQPDLKNKAEKVFHNLGLTATQAISLFYKQVELRNGLPFDVVIPNETSLQTFGKTASGKNLIVFENTDDMYGKLGM